MEPIDRVIVKVNGKVYSFLNPLFFDETERPYYLNNCKVSRLAVCIRYNQDFINDITICSDKIFRMLRSSDLYISLNGKLVESFFIEKIQYDGVNLMLKTVCPY
jgi:hypothetical protein|nr:MAG TPA: hypothetical protein [Caudoviricetes sp.]